MKNNLPKITIVTACLNSEKYIKRAIDSVMMQDYPNIEYIVKDGGSTDKTLEIVKSYGDKIKSISTPDKSIYDALRQGFTAASGEILTWLDSDNYYERTDLISSVMREFSTDTELQIVLTNGYEHYPDFNEKKIINPQDISYDFLLNHGNKFMPEQIFYSKKLYHEIGGLNLEYRLLADYELWLKFFQADPKWKKLDILSAVYTVRYDALLRKKPFQAWYESFAIGKKYERKPSAKIYFYLIYLKERIRIPIANVVKKNKWLYEIYKYYRTKK